MIKNLSKIWSRFARRFTRRVAHRAARHIVRVKNPAVSGLPLLLDCVRWLYVDFVRKIKEGKDKTVHLFGIWCYVGIYGGGKTISLVYYLEQMRAKYGDKIKIATNFYYKNEDFHLDKWEQMLDEYDCPVIFCIDELQNEFYTREYKKFPVELLSELTQNRKGHGKQILYTTQTFESVDKNFRDLTTHVVLCKTYFGRLTCCKRFKKDFYVAFTSTKSIDRKIKIKPVSRHRFVQNDYIRELYDSYRRLESYRDRYDNGEYDGRGGFVPN